MHKLILACAGAGKSRLIAENALADARKGQNVLLLTYTENNQKELLNKILELSVTKPPKVTIKGWFTFLLEDMIRPYQQCIFRKRITAINFNQTDPHKRNGRNIPGRTEKKSDGTYNPDYFLSSMEGKAHTTYLSKLAARIEIHSDGKSVQRLAAIYDSIYIDEVQDLVGWDFDVISAISKIKNRNISCVGDFRQTIYSTSIARKKPQTNTEKQNRFANLGFEVSELNKSRRCVQAICELADTIHSGDGCYSPTESIIEEGPTDYADHVGVYVVSRELVSAYIERFRPTILRNKKTVEYELCKRSCAVNFGEAKGLGFDRVLILPTKAQKQFINGDDLAFEGGKTDEARNRFYVAVTRARFSVAILCDGTELRRGIEVGGGYESEAGCEENVFADQNRINDLESHSA